MTDTEAINQLRNQLDERNRLISAMQCSLGMHVTDCMDGDAVRWCQGIMDVIRRTHLALTKTPDAPEAVRKAKAILEELDHD